MTSPVPPQCPWIPINGRKSGSHIVRLARIWMNRVDTSPSWPTRHIRKLEIARSFSRSTKQNPSHPKCGPIWRKSTRYSAKETMYCCKYTLVETLPAGICTNPKESAFWKSAQDSVAQNGCCRRAFNWAIGRRSVGHLTCPLDLWVAQEQ